MRILLASDTYAPDVNGAARFCERLAVGLTGLGHEVHVAAPSSDGPPTTEVMGDVTVHRVVSYRWPLHEWYRVSLPWTARPACRRIVEKVRPDVVHTQAHFIVGRYITKAAHELGYPLVATNHFMPENLFMHAHTPRWFEDVARSLAWKDLERVFGRAQYVTAPTPRAIELLEARTSLTGEAQLRGCLGGRPARPGPPDHPVRRPARPGEAGRRADPRLRPASGQQGSSRGCR